MIGTPVGAHRLEDGSAIVISTDGDRWCWRRLDGTFGRFGEDGVSFLGRTDRPDGHTVRLLGDDAVSFDGIAGRREPLDVADTTFDGTAGARLTGRLIMPVGSEPVPVVVLVHGAESSSAVEGDWMQWLLPAGGVGVFVYDKRGTGSSGGSYTQDFDLLADDVAAAVAEARRLAGRRVQRLGIRGASQGGWVGPMAALRAEIDFVLVVFGLAVSPLEEDRESAVAQLTTAGHGPEAIRKATEITDAMARVMRRETDDFADLDALCARYQNEPWYGDLRGNVFQAFKHLRGAERDTFFADVLTWRTPLDHDPREILGAVDVPQLWAVGADDLDAPSGQTLRRLAALRAGGRDITTVVFDGAEHGMTLFDTDDDGRRTATSYPAGYVQMILDFAGGTFDPEASNRRPLSGT